MKQIRPVISALVACGIALAMATSLSAQTTQQGVAKVVRVKGSARFMSSNNSWQPLKNGALLKSGTVIQTASESYVDIILYNPDAVASPLSTPSAPTDTLGPSNVPKAEQDAIRLFENTVLSIDKLTTADTGVETVQDTELDLKAGSILGTVKKLSAGSKYEMKIPNGVAGIRGSVYCLSAQNTLAMLSGTGFVSYFPAGGKGDPSVQQVPAGQQFDCRTGVMSPIPPALYRDNLPIIIPFCNMSHFPPPMQFPRPPGPPPRVSPDRGFGRGTSTGGGSPGSN
jgi:hypothetical protein